MLDLQLCLGVGTAIWHSSEAPSQLLNLTAPPIISEPGWVSAELRAYSLSEALRTMRVQTMAHHARSIYLGHGDDGFHYFGKGIGWCLAPGWSPELGSTGILPKWAAVRERDLSIALKRIGLEGPDPVAIYEYHSIPGLSGSTAVDANQVSDLDGTPARPSLYIYRHRRRFRLADMVILSEMSRQRLRESYWDVITRLRRSILALHSDGGHDYSLSLHNVWDDGSRVDFEYVHLPGIPHPDDRLAQHQQAWQRKEWYAFRCLAFELADMVKLDADANSIASMTSWPHQICESR